MTVCGTANRKGDNVLKTKDKKNKVYYDGNFWTHPRWARPGKKVPIGRSFYWDEKFWLIPAVYICRKGLVVDFCIRIQREEWQTFFKKRGSADGMAPHEKEDPLSYEFGAYLWVDGRRVSYAHGCSMVWASDMVEADEITQLLLECYNLNPSDAWIIYRKAFPWNQKKVKTLSVEFEQALQKEYGPSISVTDEKQSFNFIFPPTGKTHTLKVLKYSRQTIDNSTSVVSDKKLPSHCVRMVYSIEPKLPDGAFTVTDRRASDEPMLKVEPKGGKKKDGACAIAIIGGADHITEVFAPRGQGKVYVSYSSLHFTPSPTVEWQMIFYKRTIDNAVLKLV